MRGTIRPRLPFDRHGLEESVGRRGGGLFTAMARIDDDPVLMCGCDIGDGHIDANCDRGSDPVDPIGAPLDEPTLVTAAR